MPKVSIIMPVYNGEKYIKDSIESIISQTLKDWEFIIINEYGSNEETKKIINNYAKKDDRIKIIQNDVKLGISESLNVGINNSKGKYIARMDSDDISGKKRLEVQSNYLDENPNIGAIGIQATVFGDEDWEWNSEIDPEIIRAESLFFQPILHPTAMIRSEILKNNNFRYNSSYSAAEDFDFFVRLLDFTNLSNLRDKSLFYYRRHASTFTNIRKNEGDIVCKKVMENTFKKLDLFFTEKELSILYLHTEFKSFNENTILHKIINLDLLLKKILIANMKKNIYGMKELSMSLNKRWLHEYYSVIVPIFGNENKVPDNIVWQFKNSIFWNKLFYIENKKNISNKPTISVVLPLYNGQNYLFESIYSIQKQTYDDWELIVVNDSSKDDGPLVVEEYMKYDKRIRIINNKENLKISKTLNNGIKNSKGIYIARMDDDDISIPERFEKQLDVFEKYPDISVVGGWQKHFGDNDWLHAPCETPDEMKASLIFKCDVCHSIVMFKKEDFVKNDLFYNPNRISEDYDLWVRATEKLKFYTIQEVLGYYRIDGTNITSGKLEKFDLEARNITADILKKNFNIEVKEEDLILLATWSNPFQDMLRLDREKLLEKEKNLLDLIKEQNKIYNNYNQYALEKVIDERWTWANQNKIIMSLKQDGFSNKKIYKPLKNFIKKGLKKIKGLIVFPLYPIKKQLWDMDGHMWDYFDKLQNLISHQKKSIEELNFNIEKMNSFKYEELFTIINENQNDIKNLVLKIEENLIKNIEDKIIKIEENILQKMDEKIWKSEENILQKMDERIWKSEENILQKMDERIWKLEENILQKMDERIWKSEEHIIKQLYNKDKFIENNFDMTHRHIDFTYRDIMIILSRFMNNTNKDIELKTNYPIAYNSNDHIIPHGTIRDNTRYPRFIRACEQYFLALGKNNKLYFLDLGCSGGGMVLEALLKGHVSIGLEGSDVSLKQQRAEWRLIPNNLFTCDITKPFTLYSLDEVQTFDVISAWEVLEHILEEDLEQLLLNIKNHLSKDGIFIASIANWADIDPITGIDWHVTQHNYEWWKNKFEENGFIICTDEFDTIDLARGGYNPPHCYEEPYKEVDLTKGFHIVVRINNKE